MPHIEPANFEICHLGSPYRPFHDAKRHILSCQTSIFASSPRTMAKTYATFVYEHNNIQTCISQE